MTTEGRPRLKDFHRGGLITVNSKDRLSRESSGHASVPYNRMGKHLACRKASTYSSEAARPTFWISLTAYLGERTQRPSQRVKRVKPKATIRPINYKSGLMAVAYCDKSYTVDSRCRTGNEEYSKISVSSCHPKFYGNSPPRNLQCTNVAAGSVNLCCSSCAYRQAERECMGRDRPRRINGFADPKRPIMDERLLVAGVPATFPAPRLTGLWLPV